MKSIQDFFTTRHDQELRIGFFGVGYDVYWNQFPGLLDELMIKHQIIMAKVPKENRIIVDFGMIDNPETAYQKVNEIKSANIDILFCNMLTYATSGTFGVIIRNINVPIILVALQPRKALDYSQASTYMQLANDDIFALPEFVATSTRMGKKIPEMIIGTLTDDKAADTKIAEYCQIASVLKGLKSAHFAHIGHPLNAMLDMHTDATMLTSFFGCHIVQCEANEIVTLFEQATEEEIQKVENIILDFFDTPDPVSDPIAVKLRKEDLRTSAQVSVALKKFIELKKIDGLAYYYNGRAGSTEELVMSNLIVGNSMLISSGFPMCGESDLKTLIALAIMNLLGIGGSFAEFHPVDFNEDFVLVGHDGPHNISIAEGKPVLRSLKKYHGKPGSGAGVEFHIKEGPITMLSINSTYDGKYKFIIAEGESLSGPIPPTGNTNTRGVFKPDVRTFLYRWMKEGPTHHFALGLGHNAELIKKIAEYLNIEAVIIPSK